MKNSYKLIGNHWDRLPLPKTKPAVVCLSETIRKYDEEYDLMDWKYYIRKIPFSELLATENMQDVDAILQNVIECDAIVIDVDYFPLAGSEVVRCFLIKRLLQMFELIMRHCKITELYILSSRDIQEMIELQYR